MAPLSSIRIGEKFILKDLKTDDTIKRILAVRGLTVGTEVRIVSNHTDGSFVLSFRGTKLAIDKSIAQCIITEGV